MKFSYTMVYVPIVNRVPCVWYVDVGVGLFVIAKKQFVR